MTNFIRTKISEIVDSDFQLLVSELCECLNLDKNEIVDESLWFLMMVIAKDKIKISNGNVLVTKILDTKVGKLAFDSVVYSVCCELVRLNNSHIDFFSGKSVFALIKNCHKFFAPKQTRPKRPTKREISRQFEVELIKRRRKNGSL